MLPAAFALALTPFEPPNAFAPDPQYPWVVEGLRLAYREGDLMGYPETLYPMTPRPASRYEYAVALHAAETHRLERLRTFLAKPGADLEQASLVRSVALVPFYRRAEGEFRPEMDRLGIEHEDRPGEIVRLTDQLAATSAPRYHLFRDVPFGHWAAKAVGDLRALGLIDGYPDGEFRG